MDSGRFETFADAIIAIIITVLVLKFTQPNEATFSALWEFKDQYISYLMSFLIVFNMWRSNHNLFHRVKQIDNITVILNGIILFLMSIIPYFTIWLANNLYSVAAETCMGIIFLLTHIFYTLSIKALIKNDPYNKELQKTVQSSKYIHIPLIFILIGFILTYTIFSLGIVVCNFLAIFAWIWIGRNDNTPMKTERFEGFVDAILAILITIIILGILLPLNGTWTSLGARYLDFITYAISFVVIFNYWNYHHNFFSIVNNINQKVIWLEAFSLFVISFLPFITIFVSNNFNTFIAQFLYGLDFIIISLINMFSVRALISSDPANIALRVLIGNYKGRILPSITLIFGIIIGYLFYPPAIIISCIISMIITWIYHLK